MDGNHPRPKGDEQSPNRRRLYVLLSLVALVALGVMTARDVLELLEGDAPDLEEPVALEIPTAVPIPTPRNQGTRLEWDVGIQTWRHWYVGGSDEHLRAIRGQGFRWIKQRFAWADLERRHGQINFTQSDWFIGGAESTAPDTKILIQLDVPPDWARRDGSLPFDLDAWGDFVARFATQYRGRVHAYEILNEPNLASAWGAEPSPSGYAEILRVSTARVRESDPNALVVSAGMSPTATDLPSALGDVEYIEALYEAMADHGGSGYHFDALGAHAPGFKAGPEVAPSDAEATPELGGQRFFTFRRIEDIRDVMLRFGDVGKRVVVTEFGWTIDPRPESPYHWSAVSRGDRVQFTRQAFQYAADHWADWVGPMILFTAPDPAWGPDHEAYWRALTDHSGLLIDGFSLAGIRPPGVASADGSTQGPGAEAGPSTDLVGNETANAEGIQADPRGIRTAVLQLRPLVDAGLIPLPVERARHLGGAIRASAQSGDRIVIAIGTRLAVYDVSGATPRLEATIDRALDAQPATGAPQESTGQITAVAIEGNLVAAASQSEIVLFAASTLEELGRVTAPARVAVDSGRTAEELILAAGRLHLVRQECSANISSQRQECTLQAWMGDVTDDRLHQLRVWVAAGGMEAEIVPPGVSVDGDLGYVTGGPGLRIHQLDGEAELPADSLSIEGGIRWFDVSDGIAVVVAPARFRHGSIAAPGPQWPHEVQVWDVASGGATATLLDRRSIDESFDFDAHSSVRSGGSVALGGRICDDRGCGEAIYRVQIDAEGRIVADAVDLLGAGLSPDRPPVLGVLPDAIVVAGGGGLAKISFNAEGIQDTPLDPATGGLPLDQFVSFPDHVGHATVAAAVGDLLITASEATVQVFDTRGGSDALAIGSDSLMSRVGTTSLQGCGSSAFVSAIDVAATTSHALVASRLSGVTVVDVSDPSTPRQVGCLDLGIDTRAVAIEGDRAYVVGTSGAPSERSLAVVDISDPGNPRRLSSGVFGAALPPDGADSPGNLRDVAVDTSADGRTIVHVADEVEWSVLEVGEASPITHLGSYTVHPSAIAVEGGTVFVGVALCGVGCAGGIRAFTLDAEAYPEEIGSLALEGGAISLAIDADTLWATNRGATVEIDLVDPAAMRVARSIATGSGRLVLGSGIAFVAAGPDGVYAFSRAGD